MPPKKRSRSQASAGSNQSGKKGTRGAEAEEGSLILSSQSTAATPTASQKQRQQQQKTRQSSESPIKHRLDGTDTQSRSCPGAESVTTTSKNHTNSSTATSGAPSPLKTRRTESGGGKTTDAGAETPAATAAPATTTTASPAPRMHRVDPRILELERTVACSKVIAPDMSGIRACDVRPGGESELVLARENGSLALYGIEFFQNIPHFTLLRQTGGCVGRTITRVRYLGGGGDDDDSSAKDAAAVRDADGGSGAAGSDGATAAAARGGGGDYGSRFFLASYLSGQLVAYSAETLAPVSVYQRSGGAIWDFAVRGSDVFTALSDGSWHQLRVRFVRPSSSSAASRLPVPQLSLVRVVPAVSGADRALSVACCAAMRMVVGTDDGGNVHAWRPPPPADGSAEDDASYSGGGDGGGAGSPGLRAHQSLWTTRLPRGLALCVAVVGAGGPHPAVAVGTSVGDVVLLDALHGRVFATFSQHRGPVCTLAVAPSGGVSGGDVLYANGWHESLRCYRCHPQTGEWYPAEVKRRTHYHEASQLLVLPRHQMLVSASRDGTLLYAPLAALFTAPAMYVSASPQRFAYAQARDVLLHTRQGRVEGFRADGRRRRWAPLFAHSVCGPYHLSGLWCDPRLRHMAFATDERVVLVRLRWEGEPDDSDSDSDDDDDDEGESKTKKSRTAAAAAASASSSRRRRKSRRPRRAQDAGGRMVVRRLEEVKELPAGTGVVDVAFSASSSSSPDGGAGGPLESVYILFDSGVTQVTLGHGYPTVHTAFPLPQPPGTATTTAATANVDALAAAASAPTAAAGRGDYADAEAEIRLYGIRPQRLLLLLPPAPAAAAPVLTVAGARGSWVCPLSADGTMDPDAMKLLPAGGGGVFSYVAAVPQLALPAAAGGENDGEVRGEEEQELEELEEGDSGDDSQSGEAAAVGRRGAAAKRERRPAPQRAGGAPVFCVGLSRSLRRYTALPPKMTGGGAADGALAKRPTLLRFPKTLPHDVQFVAALPPPPPPPLPPASEEAAATAASAAASSPAFVATFSRGVLLVTGRQWHMARRLSGVEAAFVMRGGRRVLVLERNVERTLETLPLCWKVRRFGN